MQSENKNKIQRYKAEMKETIWATNTMNIANLKTITKNMLVIPKHK